jgi:hypothetical protein
MVGPLAVGVPMFSIQISSVQVRIHSGWRTAEIDRCRPVRTI